MLVITLPRGRGGGIIYATLFCNLYLHCDIDKVFTLQLVKSNRLQANTLYKTQVVTEDNYEVITHHPCHTDLDLL